MSVFIPWGIGRRARRGETATMGSAPCWATSFNANSPPKMCSSWVPVRSAVSCSRASLSWVLAAVAATVAIAVAVAAVASILMLVVAVAVLEKCRALAQYKVVRWGLRTGGWVMVVVGAVGVAAEREEEFQKGGGAGGES